MSCWRQRAGQRPFTVLPRCVCKESVVLCAGGVRVCLSCACACVLSVFACVVMLLLCGWVLVCSFQFLRVSFFRSELRIPCVGLVFRLCFAVNMSCDSADAVRVRSLRAFLEDRRPEGKRWTYVSLKEALRQSGWQFGHDWLAKALADHCPAWDTPRSQEQFISELRRVVAEDRPPEGWTMRKIEVAMRKAWGPVRAATVRAALREHCPDWNAKPSTVTPDSAKRTAPGAFRVSVAAVAKKRDVGASRSTKDKRIARSEGFVERGDLLRTCQRILAEPRRDGKAWTLATVGRALRGTWGPVKTSRLSAVLREHCPGWNAAPVKPDLVQSARRVLAEKPSNGEGWTRTAVGRALREEWGPIGNESLSALLREHCPNWNSKPDTKISDAASEAAVQDVLSSHKPPGRFWTLQALTDAVCLQVDGFRPNRLGPILRAKHQCPNAAEDGRWQLLLCGFGRCPNFRLSRQRAQNKVGIAEVGGINGSACPFLSKTKCSRRTRRKKMRRDVTIEGGNARTTLPRRRRGNLEKCLCDSWAAQS